MTISEKLQKINEVKGDIREAVNAKGVELSEEAPFIQYPTVISKIPQSIINMIEAPEGMRSIAVGVNDASMGSAEGVAAVTDGAIVVVKAAPADAGYALEGWYEDVDGEEELQSTELEYKFQVDRDRMLLAKFWDAYLNGRDWFRGAVSTTTTYGAHATAYGEGIWLLCRDMTSATTSSQKWLSISHDGINWSDASDLTKKIGAVSYNLSICYGDGKFVFASATANKNLLIYTPSDDTFTLSKDALPEPFERLFYLNGRFFGVAFGKFLYHATDPLSWTTVTLSTSSEYFIGIAYGNNRYVLMSRCGKTWISEDGENWNPGNTAILPSSCQANRYLVDIVYGDGVFIAYGVSTAYFNVHISTDGVTWTRPEDDSMRLSGTATWLLYGNGVFVANGGYDIIYSTDAGTTWTKTSAPDESYLYAAAYGNGTFIGWRNPSSGTSIPYYSRSRGPALP